MFDISITLEAAHQLKALEKTAHYAHVGSILGLMQLDLKHARLQTVECLDISRQRGYRIFQTSLSTNGKQGHSIVWYFNFKKNEVTIVAFIECFK